MDEKIIFQVSELGELHDDVQGFAGGLGANAQEVDDVVVVADPLHDLHLVDLETRVRIEFFIRRIMNRSVKSWKTALVLIV